MEKDLTQSFKALKQKLEKIPGNNGKVIRYIRELTELIDTFSNMKIPAEHKERYEDLLKRGNELNEGENYRNIKKIENFLPRCFLLNYEIKGEIDGIMKKLIYSFLLTSILFILVSMVMSFILTSQLFVLTTVIFVGPIYAGIKGLQKGKGRGATIGLVLIEFSPFLGLIGIYFMVTAIPKLGIFIRGILDQYKIAASSGSFIIVGIILILFLFACVGLVAISWYYRKNYKKYKKIFL